MCALPRVMRGELQLTLPGNFRSRGRHPCTSAKRMCLRSRGRWPERPPLEARCYQKINGPSARSMVSGPAPRTSSFRFALEPVISEACGMCPGRGGEITRAPSAFFFNSAAAIRVAELSYKVRRPVCVAIPHFLARAMPTTRYPQLVANWNAECRSPTPETRDYGRTGGVAARRAARRTR